MDIPTELKEMEAGLARVGKTPKDLCAAAGVNYVTWWRWRSGGDALTKTLAKVRDEYASMVQP